MAVNRYCVLNDDNLVINIIQIDDDDVSDFESGSGLTLVIDDNTEFSEIGCEYVGGYFQPVDPTELGYEGWTKDSNGVWDKAKTVPARDTYIWDAVGRDWVLLTASNINSIVNANGAEANTFFVTED